MNEGALMKNMTLKLLTIGILAKTCSLEYDASLRFKAWFTISQPANQISEITFFLNIIE